MKITTKLQLHHNTPKRRVICMKKGRWTYMKSFNLTATNFTFLHQTVPTEASMPT